MRGEHGASEASRVRNTVPRNRRHEFVNRLIATLLAAVAVSTLAACTGDPAPVGTVPDGSPVTGTVAVTTPEPTRPVEAATPESAIQFTRYFWDLYNYAYQSYDTAPLKAISDPACKFCASAIDDVARAVDSGAKSSGSTVSVIEATSPPVKITTGTLVIATVSQRPGQLMLANGDATKDPGWKKLRTDFSLAWSGNGWTVEAIDAHTSTGIRWDA